MTCCNLPLMPPNSSIGTISGFSILPVQYDHATYHMLLPHPRKKLRRLTGQKARQCSWSTYLLTLQSARLCCSLNHVGLWRRYSSMPMKQARMPTQIVTRTATQIPPKTIVRVMHLRPCSHKRENDLSQLLMIKACHRDQKASLFPLSHIALSGGQAIQPTSFSWTIGCAALARPGAKPIQWPIDGDMECPQGPAHYILQYEAESPPLDDVQANADSAAARFGFDLAVCKAALHRESKYKRSAKHS